jgi:hypothetical protein
MRHRQVEHRHLKRGEEHRDVTECARPILFTAPEGAEACRGESIR